MLESLVTKGAINAPLLLHAMIIAVLFISVVITRLLSTSNCLPMFFNTFCLLLFYRTSITFAVSVLSFLTVTCPVDGSYLAMQTLSLP